MDIEEVLEGVEWILSRALLSDVMWVKQLPGGWDNLNYQICMGDETYVVLKIWQAQPNVSDVETVIQRQLWISEHGIPTAVPMMLVSGERYAVRDGLAWTLLPCVEGGHLGNDSASLHSLGAEMARLHEIPTADCFPTDYRMGWSLFGRMYKMAEEENSLSDFLVMLKRESGLLREIIPDDLPTGILHGDLFPDNVLGEGEVAAIIDFEESWIGPCAFDLVMAFVGFGWESGSPIADRWYALLSGYESVRKLTESERAALPALHRYATLSIAAWRYWKHVMVEPHELLGERYFEMVDRLETELVFLGESD